MKTIIHRHRVSQLSEVILVKKHNPLLISVPAVSRTWRICASTVRDDLLFLKKMPLMYFIHPSIYLNVKACVCPCRVIWGRRVRAYVCNNLAHIPFNESSFLVHQWTFPRFTTNPASRRVCFTHVVIPHFSPLCITRVKSGVVG